MYVPVNLVVEDSVSKRPVEGALVKVFADTGKGVYGEMVTGADGRANFLLNGPQRYQARAYKLSTGFKNPIYFDVDPEQSNCFTIPATAISVPASTDPRTCLCSGTFRTPSGSPAPGVDIHFITRFHPLLLDGSGVVTERIQVRTDENGWVQVPLIRNGEFDVMVEGYEDVIRKIAVPDVSSCNLPDLIFEVVDHIILPAQSFQIRFGTTQEIYPQVYTSVGRLLEGTAKGEVCWTVGDSNIASLTVGWDRLILYGNSRGTTTLNAVRGDQSIVRIPDRPILPGIQIQVV